MPKYKLYFKELSGFDTLENILDSLSHIKKDPAENKVIVFLHVNNLLTKRIFYNSYDKVTLDSLLQEYVIATLQNITVITTNPFFLYMKAFMKYHKNLFNTITQIQYHFSHEFVPISIVVLPAMQ